MLRGVVQLVAAGMLACLSASSVGAETESPSAAQASPDRLISDYQTAMFQERFGDALAIIGRIPVDADNREGRAILDAMRASALLGLKRDAEAKKLIAESDALAPQIPEPSSALFLGALLTKHPEIAADTLDRMIARYPDAVRGLDWELMRFFFANEPKGQQQRNEDRRIALARLGYGGDNERGHYLAADAVKLLVKKGDAAGAAELLPDVKEPLELENMLIQKRYVALWPQLEQFAGPHLAKARADAVAAAQRAYDAAPDDHSALANYVNVLRHAGRLTDAIALRAKLPAGSAMSSADEDMGWAVNNVALALHKAGRKDEADALFASLNDAPMESEGWRVSMKINRLEFLVLDGRFDKALPLIEPTAKAKGSPYADQLVRRLRYCTLTRLGRSAEADKFKPELLSHAADAPGPTIDGLLCGGDLDGAEKVAVTALANPDADKRMAFEEDFVRQLQPVPLTGDDPSVWQGRWGELRKRPAIAAAFDRLGRDMPPQFLPDAPR